MSNHSINTMQALSQLGTSQRRIMDIVRRNGPVSRAELTQLSGLTAGAITRIIRELMLLDLITEEDRRVGLRGQPALPLVISGTGGVAIGIAMPYGRIDLVAIDYAGKTLAVRTAPYESKDSGVFVEIFKRLLDELLAEPEVAGRRLVGAGIALAGNLISLDPVIVQMPPTMDWFDLPAFIDGWRDILPCDLYFENIGNSAAIAEFHAASEPGFKNLVAVNLGHGIGCGLVLDGRIHRGLKGFAGEVGRLFPNADPRPSVRDLLTTLRAAGRDLPDIDALGNLDIDEDLVLSAWIARVAKQLFSLIRPSYLLIAPQRIVITGMLPPKIGAALAGKLNDLLAREIATHYFPQPKLLAAELGTLASAIGAAWLPILSESGPADGGTVAIVTKT